MTEQLKTLMDRAADRDFAAVDLDAITSAGDRTVRRRKIAGGIAGVAALAAIVTGAALLGDDGDRKTDFVDDPFRTDVPMWTVGSTLHTPSATYDLGVDVYSFARTSEGVVYIGAESGQRLGVYSFTGEGEPERIGRAQDSRLRADPGQPFAGWLDGTQGDVAAVVYDQRTGERVLEEPTKIEYSYPIVAIDGTRAYLADVDEGPVAVVDLETGDRTELPDSETYRYFLAVEGDVVAHLIPRPGGGISGIEVGVAEGGGVKLPGIDADGAVFSPGGRWISTFGGSVTVHDTETGGSVEVDTGGYSDGAGYEWLDGDTLMVIGASRDATDVALLSCEIPAGTCTRQATLAGFEQRAIYAVGFGEAIWDVNDESSGSDSVTVEVEATETSTIEAE